MRRAKPLSSLMLVWRRLKVAEFIILSAKSVCRLMLLKAAHTSDASLDPTMVLFKSVVIPAALSDDRFGWISAGPLSGIDAATPDIRLTPRVGRKRNARF
jgi:hypothetical protein